MLDQKVIFTEMNQFEWQCYAGAEGWDCGAGIFHAPYIAVVKWWDDEMTDVVVDRTGIQIFSHEGATVFNAPVVTDKLDHKSAKAVATALIEDAIKRCFRFDELETEHGWEKICE